MASSLTTYSPVLKTTTGDAVELSGGITAANVVNTGIEVTTTATLSGAGAVPLTARYVFLTTAGTGADALTLADGADGQVITVITSVETAGGDTSVITPANMTNGTASTHNAPGDSTTFIFDGTGWVGFETGTAAIA